MNFRRVNVSGLAILAALMLLWEICSRSSANLQSYFPPPSAVFAALAQLSLARELFGHLLNTLARFLGGYLSAAAIAVALGVVLGYSRFAYSLFEVLIELLRPMPSVAIIPVAILLLGIGNAMMVAVTAYACAWPILLNTIDGVRNIDRVLVHTARTFGLSQRKAIMKVIRPAASPQIVTELRISLAITLILVVISEMVGSTDGIGYFILDAQRRLKVDRMYAGMLSLALLGYLLNQVFVVSTNFFLSWHRGMTKR